jgi:putative membrane protein
VPDEVWRAWTADPWVLLAIGGAAWLYARGVGRLWARAGAGRGIRRWRLGCYAAGLAALALALLSPLHALGGALFWAHMSQHQVLILVAAPLIVLGAPHVAVAWALPRGWARAITHGVLRAPPILAVWRVLAHPVGAWTVHGAAVWLWHVPSLYEATLTREWAHTLQHFSFFGTAALFWWSVVGAGARRGRQGLAALLVFTTALHNGMLGALLTFARHPWYPAYGETAARWGLTGLEDQQLGGLIMWIPGGVVYLGFGLALLAGWIRASERAGAAAARVAPGVAAPR